MRMGKVLAALAAGLALAAGGRADAQSFGCTQGRTAIEKAICASPALRDADALLAKAYQAVLAQDQTRAADATRAQRQWLGERDRICAPRPGAPANPGSLTACLDRQYRSRLAGLDVEAARLLSASLPSIANEPVARLSREIIGPSGEPDVLLQVTAPGRFAVRVESATGTALQLVDMIQGPGEIAGDAGMRDGRLDILLDIGTYKIRTSRDPKAAGESKLTVLPFRDAEPPSRSLIHGGELATALSDLEQRSFWVAVRKPGRVSIEAAGRALGDLRLWRNGRDLSELKPRLRTVEPNSGRPLTSARLEGTVEPGVYLATAYGRSPLPWADGSADSPLHLRVGDPPLLAGGWAEGTVGPFGTARYALPAAPSYLRLDMPEPAPARVTVVRRGETLASAEISKRSREPVAEVRPSSGGERVVEIAASEGQPFRLRALEPATSRSISGSGPHWIALDVSGEGADELPATALLARMDPKGGATVLASDLPRIGQGQAWRRRFNLRGASTILFEATGPVPVAVKAEGVGTRVSIEPLLGRTAPRVDGKTRSRWDLEAGWYSLRVEPVNNAVGVLDLTIGPPGLAPDLPKPGPERLTIPFGVHTLAKDGSHSLLVNVAPGLVTAPVARALPADLGAAPLSVMQKPGQPLELPVRLPAQGDVRAAEPSGAAVPFARLREALEENASARIVTLRLPPSERPRLVTLWSVDEPGATGELPRFERPVDLDLVRAGQPRFFDLARDEPKSFALDVPEGGLYRVETLGRLQTSAAISTSFIPSLDKDKASGPGENALVQSYLRAGRYRVMVSASESNGRLGLLARPARLIEGDRLLPEGSVRASLDAGAGVAFPIEVAESGSYRLDLLGLGRTFTARLEDADGWPLAKPGELAVLQRRFDAGRYRLVVLPEPVDARVIARLQPVRPAEAAEGHGPHTLPFDSTQTHQWREPQGRGDPRVPDRWEFALQGAADVTIEIGDGMIGELKQADAPGQPVDKVVTKIVAKSGFSGRLEAGAYAVEARSLGRNDRLDYALTLRAKELQPGRPRRVSLPAALPFTVAEERVASLTTFGSIDVRAVLRGADGRVIERVDDRADDWNIALSRRLPAGAYVLELSALPGAKASGGGDERQESSSGQESSSAAGDSDAGDARAEPASGDSPSGGFDGDTVEVALSLPATGEARELRFDGVARAEGPEVHRFSIPAPAPGSLVLVAARGAGEFVLSLERQEPDGRWATRGLDRGKSPLVAAPAEADGRPWRVSAWAVDGGAAALSVAARAVMRPAQPLGEVALEPVALDPLGEPVFAGLAAAPGAALVGLAAEGGSVLEGSTAGQALAPAGSLVAPQSDRLWLVSRGVRKVGAVPAGQAEERLALNLAEGAVARIPQRPVPSGAVRLWRADSTFGQPGIEAGRGMGVAPGSALALAGAAPLRVWNAGDSEALRVSLASFDVRLAAPADAGAAITHNLAPGAGQSVRLPPGAKRLTLALPPQTGAVAGRDGPDPVTVWSGAEPASRTLEGAWADIMLVNVGDATAAVSAIMAPVQGEPRRLATGEASKGFVGAAGSIAMPVEAAAGDRLAVAGATATFVARDGKVLRGTALTLPGPGELVLRHEAGLVAAWVERPGLSPWPAASARSVSPPQVVRLEGAAMALGLDADAPRLLHVRSTAPVILALAGKGEAGGPLMYPSGAEFHQYQTAGASELRLYSPHDGPLAGSLEVTATPVTPVKEGVGEPVAVAPGGTALFGFELTQAGKVGVGVRAEPDRADVRLLDGGGRVLGEGVAQLHRLEPGRYVLEARVPADGAATTVRPTVLGIAPPPAGPPAEITLKYLEMVGLAPAETR
jgi:uncharacterized protein